MGSVVWYRSKAKIKNIFKCDRSETPSSGPYARGLPQELLEMIVAHVQFDIQTLKACSMTCRSWYIATLPHLHHTITLRRKGWDPTRGGLAPLRKLDKMRLLPFVKRLRVRHRYADPFLPPEIWNAQCLIYFSALANIQELGFDGLDLRLFVPEAKHTSDTSCQDCDLSHSQGRGVLITCFYTSSDYSQILTISNSSLPIAGGRWHGV